MRMSTVSGMFTAAAVKLALEEHTDAGMPKFAAQPPLKGYVPMAGLRKLADKSSLPISGEKTAHGPFTASLSQPNPLFGRGKLVPTEKVAFGWVRPTLQGAGRALKPAWQGMKNFGNWAYKAPLEKAPLKQKLLVSGGVTAAGAGGLGWDYYKHGPAKTQFEGLDPTQKMFTQAVLESMANNPETKHLRSPNISVNPNLGDVNGQFTPLWNTIQLRSDADNADILHEIAHYVTYKNKNNTLIDKMRFSRPALRIPQNYLANEHRTAVPMFHLNNGLPDKYRLDERELGNRWESNLSGHALQMLPGSLLFGTQYQDKGQQLNQSIWDNFRKKQTHPPVPTDRPDYWKLKENLW